ncbi:hypothetical protein SAMN05216391_10935 [Lachnospiraceae bacterium KHCPX20]|nr:hypothetical protein SAMN05216391_10935 [Lachnospiraceae bacterium KHCPX20]
MNTINDEFGKKIGGSKRDQWKIRGFLLEDLVGMNDAEIARDVKKNNIFPTPDYRALKEQGVDVNALYFRKIIRDALATKPIHVGKEWAEKYTSGMLVLKEELSKMLTWNQCKWFKEEVLIRNGFLARNKGSLYITSLGESVGIYKVYKKTRFLTEGRVKREIDKKNFLLSDFEIFSKQFCLEKKSGIEFEIQGSNGYLKKPGSLVLVRGLTQEAFDKILDNEYLLIRKYSFMGYGTRDNLLEKIKDLYTLESVSQTTVRKRKKKFIPKDIAVCERRKNGIILNMPNITSDEMLDTFHFYGGEFGTWENEQTRQESLNLAYFAFADLALALGVKKESIAFNHRLSIAFGARGRGGAAAHYEPAREVINLTRNKGAGCLAHEYGHALDDILSKKYGNSVAFTELRASFPSINDLLSTMKYKGSIMTDFYKGSREFDRLYSKTGNGYWASDTEMFARAFSCYIEDVLKDNFGIENDFLCGKSDLFSYKGENGMVRAYPYGEERIAINKKIDAFLKDLKQHGLF